MFWSSSNPLSLEIWIPSVEEGGVDIFFWNCTLLTDFPMTWFVGYAQAQILKQCCSQMSWLFWLGPTSHKTSGRNTCSKVRASIIQWLLWVSMHVPMLVNSNVCTQSNQNQDILVAGYLIQRKEYSVSWGHWPKICTSAPLSGGKNDSKEFKGKMPSKERL